MSPIFVGFQHYYLSLSSGLIHYRIMSSKLKCQMLWKLSVLTFFKSFFPINAWEITSVRHIRIRSTSIKYNGLKKESTASNLLEKVEFSVSIKFGKTKNIRNKLNEPNERHHSLFYWIRWYLNVIILKVCLKSKNITELSITLDKSNETTVFFLILSLWISTFFKITSF